MTEKRESETRELEYELHPAEIMDKAKELADMESKLSALEADRKSMMTKFKFLKSDLEETRRELSKAVTTGVGTKEVECEWVPMWKQQQWVLQRTDTGDIIEQETMTKDDLQTSIPEDDAVNDNGDSDEKEAEEKPKRKPRRSKKSATRSKAAGTED